MRPLLGSPSLQTLKNEVTVLGAAHMEASPARGMTLPQSPGKASRKDDARPAPSTEICGSVPSPDPVRGVERSTFLSNSCRRASRSLCERR